MKVYLLPCWIQWTYPPEGLLSLLVGKVRGTTRWPQMSGIYSIPIQSIKCSWIWWYRNAVKISLWWISPNAFYKSTKVTINERCWFFACLIKWDSWAVCSNVAVIAEVKPFWTELSTYSFFSRNSWIVLRIADVNIFKGTDSKVIGLKLPGSTVASFLWIK